VQDRGTGFTTKQMREAEPGALFVWCNSDLSYPKHLAHNLGRDDLRIVGPSVLNESRLLGQQCQIVVDHATRLTFSQIRVLTEYRQLCQIKLGRKEREA
jgi:hypothetical protein